MSKTKLIVMLIILGLVVVYGNHLADSLGRAIGWKG